MGTISWDHADVRVDDEGALSLSADGLTYLTRWRPTHLRDRRHELELGRPEIARLPDEIELTWTVPTDVGDLVVAGRHSFGVVWSQRWVVRRPGPDPVGTEAADAVDVATDPEEPLHLRFDHAVDPHAICWAFGAGVESSVSVQPFDPELPVLGLATQQGALAVRTEHIELGPYRLGTAGAAVVELRGDLFPHAAAFGRGVHEWLPPTTYFSAGELVVITHPDAGLVTDPDPDDDADGLDDPDGPYDPLPSADQVLASAAAPAGGPGSEFVAGSDSEQLLVFHGARGPTEVTLHWAKPLGEAIGSAAGAALAGPRAGNGVPVLSDPQSGLLVQRALADHAEIDALEAADALDLLASRDARRTPWQVMFDCAEFHRTGDDDQLIRAHHTFLSSEPSAGTGLAASRLVVALLSVGRNPAPVLSHLRAIRDTAVDEDVRLELALVIGTVFGAGHEVESARASARQLAQVAARLGSGLRGRAVPDLPPVERARLLSLLSLLPELAALWQDRLAVRPGRLVQYAANRVLYELEVGVDATPADRQSLIWLSLASDT